MATPQISLAPSHNSAKSNRPPRTDSEFFRAKLARTTYLHLLRLSQSIPDTQITPSIHLLGNALLLTSHPQPDALRRCMAQLITGDYPSPDSTQIEEPSVEEFDDFKLILNKASYERIEAVRDEIRPNIQARPDIHMICNAMLLTASTERNEIKTTIVKLLLGEAF